MKFRLAYGSADKLMVPAQRSDPTRASIASGGDLDGPRGAGTAGGVVPRRRRQLVRLADVVTFTNNDFRNGLVDVAKVNNVERMLQARVQGRRAGLILKRAVDIIGAAFALLLLLPLLTLAALAVRMTTSGPIIYSQLRYGLNGKPFRIYKLRTFYADRCDDSGIQQAVADDRRITPLGRLFRRTNIDELPQLWNVLKGDMSLVGPRPHAIGMHAGGTRYEHLVLVYPMRTLVKPGITGLAQLRGFRGPTRDRTSARMRIVCDLQYVAESSNMLDVKILVLTVWRELRGGTGG